MDANIILGLGLYTIIGVAPLIYNYYVVNKRHAATNNSSEKRTINTVDGIHGTHSVREASSTHMNTPPIVPLNRRIRTPPIIVFVLNKNNLEDPEIRRLVITYLTRSGEKEEAKSVVTGEAPLELGVRDIAAPGIQVIGTERMAVVEA